MRSLIDRTYLLSTLQRLIRFPSVNPPGNVKDINAFVMSELERLSIAKVWTLAEEPSKPNVIADLGSGDGQPAVLLYSHTDVVGVSDEERKRWRYDPFEGVVTDGVIYGRGAVDCKSKVAALLTAAKALSDANVALSRRARLIFEADGERGDAAGIKYLKAKEPDLLRADMMVACEPSQNRILRTYKGRLWLRVVLDGPDVHSLVPESGVNAVAEMLKVLHGLMNTGFSEEPDLSAGKSEGGGVMGGVSLTPTSLHAGNALNVSPGAAIATFDVRFVPGQTAAGVLSDLEKTAARYRSGTDKVTLSLEVIPGSVREPAVVSQEAPVVRHLARAIERATGSPAAFEPGYSVGGLQHFWDLNVPGVYFGNGGIWQAHVANEQAPLGEIEEMAAVYTQLIADQCESS